MSQEIIINKIVRSRRRTVALIVTQDAMLVVRAPIRTPLEYIRSLVRKKQTWIKRKLNEAAVRKKMPERKYAQGEEFLYLARKYRLCLVDSDRDDVSLDGDRLHLSRKAAPRAREVLRDWYKAEAQKIITARCGHYAKATGYRPVSVKVTNAERRWGSCGPKGTLNFSWRLIMAPLQVIDYVIVHELVHTERLDHSIQFWNRVRAVIPDCDERKKWLKENDMFLTL